MATKLLFRQHTFSCRKREKMIYTFLIGLLIGIVAKMLMPGRDPGGFIITALIGIVGAAAGSYLGQLLGFYAAGEPAGFIMSVVGAMILLWGYRMVAPASA